VRGVLIAPAVLACLLIAGCGGSSGNTTIINNNQTTVTSATPTSTTTPASTTTAPATTSTTVEKPVDPEPAKPEPPQSGPVRCGEAGVVTGGSQATADEPAKPGFFDLETEGESCAVAISVAAAWTNEWEQSACAAGCVKKVGELHCRYAGSGSGVACQGPKSSLTFALAFPD